jgi:hypothetical protein
MGTAAYSASMTNAMKTRSMRRPAALAAAGALVLASCSGAAPEAPAMAAPSAVPAVPAAAAESRQPAAGPTPSAPRASVAPDPSTEVHAELLRAIGNAACSDDSQCRTLALGAKACGGPEGYLAWSVLSTDARQLEALALRYREARQARNQRLGLVSDCAVVLEPPVRCAPVEGAARPRNQCRTLRGRGSPTLITR